MIRGNDALGADQDYDEGAGDGCHCSRSKEWSIEEIDVT
jgi:hypothetical protein